MRHAYIEAVDFLESVFRRFELQVPPPKWVLVHGREQARYEEKTPEQVLIQKFARQVTGLHAIDLLLAAGLSQEQGVIQRVLDEIHEDIFLIAQAVIRNEWSQVHENYLRDFWAEEFDDPDPVRSTQKRKSTPRKKIRAQIAQLHGEDAERSKQLSETLHKTYSGFVHAASTHIMDMCAGDPPRFMMKIPRSHPRLLDQVADAWSYYYRGLLSAGIIGMAFRDQDTIGEVYRFLDHFESKTGKSYSDEFRG